MSDNWIQTYRGRAFDIREEPLQFDIEDIAFSLSKQCRYAGQIKRHYSVALHSLCVERALQYEAHRIGWTLDKSVDVAMWALMHDAGEAYLVDIPSPFKSLPELEGYRSLERWLDERLRKHYEIDVSTQEIAIVRALDVGMLFPEKLMLHVKSPRPWKYGAERIDSCVRALNDVMRSVVPNAPHISCYSTAYSMDEVACAYIARYKELVEMKSKSKERWKR